MSAALVLVDCRVKSLFRQVEAGAVNDAIGGLRLTGTVVVFWQPPLVTVRVAL